MWTILTDTEHIVRWVWSTHAKNAERIAALQQQRPELVMVRLRERRDVREWVDGALWHAASL